jgi:hypothetical protein
MSTRPATSTQHESIYLKQLSRQLPPQHQIKNAYKTSP